MKKVIFLLVLSLIILSCSRTKKGPENTDRQKDIADSIKYSNKIIETAINAHLMDRPYYSIPNDLKKEISTIRREVKDTVLGITLRLHSWGDGQNFAPEIIYVSNNKDFEYVFPFQDEYYYYELQSSWVITSQDEDLMIWFKHQMKFTQQLNFILSGRGLNKKSKLAQLQRFITVFEDSILKINAPAYDKRSRVSCELTLKDTAYLENIIIHKQNINKPFSDCVTKNIKNIISDLKNYTNKSVRYFRPIEGLYAFWRFEIINDDNSTVHVETSFENKECYFNMFY